MNLNERIALLARMVPKADRTRLRALAEEIPALDAAVERTKLALRQARDILEMDETRVAVDVKTNPAALKAAYLEGLGDKNEGDRKLILRRALEHDVGYQAQLQAVGEIDARVIDAEEEAAVAHRTWLALTTLMNLSAAQCGFLAEARETDDQDNQKGEG